MTKARFALWGRLVFVTLLWWVIGAGTPTAGDPGQTGQDVLEVIALAFEERRTAIVDMTLEISCEEVHLPVNPGVREGTVEPFVPSKAKVTWLKKGAKERIRHTYVDSPYYRTTARKYRDTAWSWNELQFRALDYSSGVAATASYVVAPPSEDERPFWFFYPQALSTGWSDLLKNASVIGADDGPDGRIHRLKIPKLDGRWYFVMKLSEKHGLVPIHMQEYGGGYLQRVYEFTHFEASPEGITYPRITTQWMFGERIAPEEAEEAGGRVFERAGNKIVYTIERAKFNTGLSDDEFLLDIPDGFTVLNYDLGQSGLRPGVEYTPGEMVQDLAADDQHTLGGVPPFLGGKPLPGLTSLGIGLPEGNTGQRRILVCFWDLDQRPSRHCLKELAKRAQELEAEDTVVTAVQASKVDRQKLDQWLQELGVAFSVGMVGDDEEKTRLAWGVRGLPWLILTDRKHIVTAEGFPLTELDAKLEAIRENAGPSVRAEESDFDVGKPSSVRTGRARMIDQLLSKGLPVSPPLHRATKDQLAGKSIEELIKDVGNQWSATAVHFGGRFNWASIHALTSCLPKNVRVIRIIEEGRRDPGKVGALLAADLRRRIREFPETYRRFREATDKTADGSLGFAMGHDGAAIGSNAARKFEEDRYAISAAMWILVNIEYAKGVDAIAEFGFLLEHPNRRIWAERDMVRTYLCPGIAVYAGAMLLREDTSPKFAGARQAFAAVLKDMEVSGGRETVNGSHALYPTGHLGLAMTRIDTSSQPTLQVDVPNASTFAKLLDDDNGDALLRLLWEAVRGRSQAKP